MSDAVPPSLPAALEAIARWREGTEGDVVRALDLIGGEEEEIRRQVTEGNRQLQALSALRQEQDTVRDSLNTEERRRQVEAVREALATERNQLLARNQLWRHGAERQAAELEQRLADGDLSGALAEYERVLDNEANLSGMSFAWRQAHNEQRERVVRRLDPFIRRANAAVEIDAPRLGVSVVMATDPPDDRPESIITVLPVPFSVYQEWMAREDDLTTLLTYRVVTALYMLLREIGALDAVVRYFELHGCLAVQVWLGDHLVPDDLQERTLDLIQTMSAEASELDAAGVDLYALWLLPGLLVGAS